MGKLFGFYISYPTLTYDSNSSANLESEQIGDAFRDYIWGKNGFAQLFKDIYFQSYGSDVEKILVKIYIEPLEYELRHIKEIESYRRKEKSIALTIVLDRSFLDKNDEEKKKLLKTKIMNLLECMDVELNKKKKLLFDNKTLIQDLQNI